MKKSLTVVVLGLLVAGLPVQAQQLTLFETVQEERGPQESLRAEMPAMGPAAGAPQFSLRSNNRFGADYHSVLVGPDGSVIDIRWQQGQRVAVPNHAGYSVVGVSASGLSLEYPGNVQCQSQPQAGVSCTAAGMALLSLAPLPPLPRNDSREPAPMGPQQMEAGVIGDMSGVVVDPEGNPVFDNPFAAAMEAATAPEDAETTARAERARARADRLQQFQIERIPEDQVPPGMRLVRTPFGDRLVPVRQ